MLTFRRELLDKELNAALSYMKGNVLDVGGKKTKKRGTFRPPTENTLSWKYLNPDKTTDPDYCITADSIPLEANSVDTVIITELLEYIEDIDKTMKEISRIIKKGGICLISVPFLVPVHGDKQYDRQRFTNLGLQDLLLKHGFSTVQCKTMGSVGAVLFDILHVACGYAFPSTGKIFQIILLKLLHIGKPVFKLIDTITRHQSEYVNTGYFIIASK